MTQIPRQTPAISGGTIILPLPRARPRPRPRSLRHTKMALSPNLNIKTERKLPVLLFEIMDTIVRDPFYDDVPPFFGMSFEELIETKHPTAWNEFERGLIDEMELAKKFFRDGRPFNLEGLKNCMKRGYSYVDGVEELLCTLKHNNYEMHAFTNYPIWYEMIEEKLNVSAYLSWTFCSCTMGKRKPDPEIYLEVLRLLEVDPGNCIFIDDISYGDNQYAGMYRLGNVEAATEVGIVGLHFKNADSLRDDLFRVGVDILTGRHEKSLDQKQLTEEQTSS